MPDRYCTLCFQLIEIPIGIVLPFTGWLADVYFSRYKVLLGSIGMMWTSAALLTIILVIEYFFSFTNYIQLALLATLGFGYGCFQANIIQFGIDQLTDASSVEILSFINWYSWTYISSGVLANYILFKCASTHVTFIAPLFLLVVLSIVVVSVFMCNHSLIKEPVTKNPFKLMYQVIKYAQTHKYPRLRSAFTYCEDSIPSRIDLGKSKYGGPFTTEQVEDVKTFFRGLGLVVLVGAVFGVSDCSNFKTHLLGELIASQRNSTSYGICSLSFVFTDTYYISVAVLIPLNEVLIYPLFHRCLLNMKHNSIIFLGLMLQMLGYIAQVTILVISRQQYIMNTTDMFDPMNATVTTPCVFQQNFLLASSSIYYYRLNVLPDVLFGISYATVLIGAIGFLCAQIPYSMKGLIVGIFYSAMVFFFVLNQGMARIFKEISSSWKTDTSLSCGFWYLLIKLLIVLIAIVALSVMSLYYKKRNREDVLPNEHIFAERFYSSK